jgi:hypothetical protein
VEKAQRVLPLRSWPFSRLGWFIAAGFTVKK